MGELILVRHGQANSCATNEEDYDRLSELGHQQAAWLGAHLRALGQRFDRVITGALRRHKETAAGMGDLGADHEEDPRWNELDYYTLSHALRDAKGVPHPTPDEFADHFPQVIDAWKRDEIRGQESYVSFEDRLTAALADASEPGRRVICITSGGVIGTVIAGLLGLGTKAATQIMLPIRNSSVHRLDISDQGARLALFNAHPHLDAPDRHYARTTY